MLSYEDGNSAMDWLVRVFGFVERCRWTDDSGRLTHGELVMVDQMVMLASPTAAYQSPKTLRREYPRAEEWLSVPYIINGVLVYVQDVREHFAHAVSEEAKILTPLEEGPPGTRYRVEDLEGQRWYFMQHP